MSRRLVSVVAWSWARTRARVGFRPGRWLALVLALACSPGARVGAAPNLTWDEARARSARIRDPEYRLSLVLEAGKTDYRGEIVIGFQHTGSGDTFLDFQGEELSSMTVNDVAVKGAAVKDDRVSIPGNLLRPGGNEIRITYRNDYDKDGAGFHRVVDPADGREYVFTDFEPFDANRLFPCFDQPDLKGSYDFEVTAPPSWQVVSNGRTLSTRDQGSARVHRFEVQPRFSTYIVALCAGPFAVWSDPRATLPSRILCTQSMARYMDADEVFEITRQGFRFFQSWFGIAYPFKKYDQVFLPQFNSGAMENVACVTFNERHVYRHQATELERQGRADTILHELAHMWFGDIVTMEWWNDLWLNESFATYMANLALVEATRFKDAWEAFATGEKGWAYWQDQLPTTHPIETEVPDTRGTFSNFDGITYAKGASVLKQLAFHVGIEAFRKGVSAYLKRHSWKNATRKDFMDSIAAAAGVDLDEWTRVWLKTSGVNTLTPRLTVGGGRIREFRLEQGEGNGDKVLRPHALQVAFYSRKGPGRIELSRVEKVQVQGASTRIARLEGGAAPDFVDANHDDHAYAKVFLDEGSLAFAKRHLEELPTSSLRAKVWNTLWMMVRDAAVAPAVYLDLFLSKASFETEPRILDEVFGRYGSLSTILSRYLDDRDREAYQDRLQALSWERVRAVATGSDLQKIWYGGLVLTAGSQEALARLAGLLEGTVRIPGIELDQDRRWGLVQKLAAHGHPKARALIDREKARDATERGQKTAWAAWVALPDPAVKAEAWKRFVEDKEAPLDHLRAGMGSFHQVHQRELTRSYVEKYFAALPGLATTRDDYFFRSFVSNLYPGLFIETGTRERTGEALALKPELPDFARRALLESRDDLERALRVRGLLR